MKSMVKFVGNYHLIRSENVDAYYKAVGAPYMIRKLLCNSNPEMNLHVDESGKWTIVLKTWYKTLKVKFYVGVPFEDYSIDGRVKNIPIQKGNSFIITSVMPNGTKIVHTYEFDNTECIITMRHKPTGVQAKRYYMKVKSLL